MEITPILIALVVLIVLFLLFREINLWYWKINERIEISQKQNLLLEIIANHLTGGKLTEEMDRKETSSDQSEKDDSEISNSDVYSTLSKQEKIDVDAFMYYGLSKGDKLVINKKTRKIDRFDEDDWNKIKRKLTQVDWIIISEK